MNNFIVVIKEKGSLRFSGTVVFKARAFGHNNIMWCLVV